jgi:hypothetical protein
MCYPIPSAIVLLDRPRVASARTDTQTPNGVGNAPPNADTNASLADDE